ncbi:unnamed protein product [Heligmosomoides polygyrus]|uniref:ANK_REP_REGION domain-containing protein n=1 Tax=Heligmosomoides polygyrus TaxID=6339 RepID=A0A183F3B2_HELPZ|nr:unnamed protein product [Heligmosomoides polygyrus]
MRSQVVFVVGAGAAAGTLDFQQVCLRFQKRLVWTCRQLRDGAVSDRLITQTLTIGTTRNQEEGTALLRHIRLRGLIWRIDMLPVVHLSARRATTAFRSSVRWGALFADFWDIESDEEFASKKIRVVLTMNFDGVLFNKLTRSQARPIYIRLEGLLFNMKNDPRTDDDIACDNFLEENPDGGASAQFILSVLSTLLHSLKEELRTLKEGGVRVQDSTRTVWTCYPQILNGVIDFAGMRTIYICPRWLSDQGCHLCIAKGERMGRSVSWCITAPSIWNKRTHASILRDAEANQNGLGGLTQMMDFFTMERCRVDALHALSEGVSCDLFRDYANAILRTKPLSLADVGELALRSSDFECEACGQIVANRLKDPRVSLSELKDIQMAVKHLPPSSDTVVQSMQELLLKTCSIATGLAMVLDHVLVNTASLRTDFAQTSAHMHVLARLKLLDDTVLSHLNLTKRWTIAASPPFKENDLKSLMTHWKIPARADKRDHVTHCTDFARMYFATACDPVEEAKKYAVRVSGKHAKDSRKMDLPASIRDTLIKCFLDGLKMRQPELDRMPDELAAQPTQFWLDLGPTNESRAAKLLERQATRDAWTSALKSALGRALNNVRQSLRKAMRLFPMLRLIALSSLLVVVAFCQSNNLPCGFSCSRKAQFRVNIDNTMTTTTCSASGANPSDRCGGCCQARAMAAGLSTVGFILPSFAILYY